MFKQVFALCFALVSFANAAIGPEIESIEEPSHCDRVPRQYHDLCLSSIKANGAFTFRVLESTPDRTVIEPIDPSKSNEPRAYPNESQGRSPTAFGQVRAEERNTAALEAMAISASKTAEASQRTSYAISIIAAINVLGVIVGIIALIR